MAGVCRQDKRLFQCGISEAGLVKYDKCTCTKMNSWPRRADTVSLKQVLQDLRENPSPDLR